MNIKLRNLIFHSVLSNRMDLLEKWTKRVS